jgi:hypothetical protein
MLSSAVESVTAGDQHIVVVSKSILAADVLNSQIQVSDIKPAGNFDALRIYPFCIFTA